MAAQVGNRRQEISQPPSTVLAPQSGVIAQRKLRMVDTATTATDLRQPPGNRLEPLRGDRIGQWSIRINDQWRVCFRWQDGNAEDVEFVNYH